MNVLAVTGKTGQKVEGQVRYLPPFACVVKLTLLEDLELQSDCNTYILFYHFYLPFILLVCSHTGTNAHMCALCLRPKSQFMVMTQSIPCYR